MDSQATKGAAALQPTIKSSNSPMTPTAQLPTLPDEPLIIIKRNRSASLNLAEIWAHRELFFFLIWRDLKVRYKQTILGALWAVMQPLLMTVIFTVFLGWLARVPSDQFPYAVFVNAALLPWTFFANAVTSSSISLVASSHLITKVYFPRLLIPAAAVGARLVDFAIAFVILAGLMVWYRIMPGRNILMLPVLILVLTTLSLALGIVSSAWNVRFRDVGVILPVLIQLWMFASPVVYSSSLVPAKWRWVYALNPLTGIIGGFRASLLNQPFDWVSLAISGAIAVILLAYSLWVFQRVERDFADVI